MHKRSIVQVCLTPNSHPFSMTAWALLIQCSSSPVVMLSTGPVQPDHGMLV